MSIRQTVKRKRIEYWKRRQIDYAIFDLVPVNVVHDSNPFWNECVMEIKNAGFDYRIIETIETITEERP